MTIPCRDYHPTKADFAQNRRGMTLLEVLVACGILVVGLASIASIMPAAGTRLSQAAIEDRAGATAANAYADLVSRGLVSADIFANTRKACYIGAGITDFNFTTFNEPSCQPASQAAAATIAGSGSSAFRRIDPTRGFFSEDELVYVASGTSDTPTNQFLANAAGPREYREGLCWGALLAPAALPAAAGGEATLSVTVFRKNPVNPKPMTLSGTRGSPLFQSTTGSIAGLVDEQDRKQMLPGCSFVLALPSPVSGFPPRFLRITSSWTSPNPLDAAAPNTSLAQTRRQSFVVLDLDPIDAADLANYVLPADPSDSENLGVSLNILAFENLMRVDQYTLTLD